MKKSRVETTIDSEIMAQWNFFLMQKYGVKKGPYGKELGQAMKNHMKKFTINKSDTKTKITKTTLEILKLIAAGCEMLPDTKIKPITIKSIIKKYGGLIDNRSINKYQAIILENSKMIDVETEPFPLLDLEGFCMYVRKLSYESY